MSAVYTSKLSFRVLFDPCLYPLSPELRLGSREVYYGLQLGSFLPGTVLQDLQYGTSHTVLEHDGLLELQPVNKRIDDLICSLQGSKPESAPPVEPTPAEPVEPAHASRASPTSVELASPRRLSEDTSNEILRSTYSPKPSGLADAAPSKPSGGAPSMTP